MKNDCQPCALCLKSKKLLDSHIIPEFCYKLMYDSLHRATELTIEPFKKEFVQKGWRENLLCEDCEGVINKYETYFSNTWYQQKKLPDKIEHDTIILHDLDYANFKLFHLSVLWRASISTIDQFKNINIIQRHQERLRQMILSSTPGSEDRYSFFAVVLTDKDNNVFHEAIMTPVNSKYAGHRVYVFIFAGCCWYYFVSNHSMAEHLYYCFSKSGDLFLVKRNFSGFDYIADFQKSYKLKLLSGL